MSMQVVQQRLTVTSGNSEISQVGGLVLSLRTATFENADVVIGSPGQRNVLKSLSLGDAVLFESPTDGILEVRVLALRSNEAKFLISRVSPRLGFAAALEQDVTMNAPFHEDEIAEIKRSTEKVYLAMSERSDVSPEQLELIQRSLVEIAEASQRLGRKDWIMFVAGTLSNVCVGAAFSQEVAKAIFQCANHSFGWVFQNAIRLLS